MPTIKGYVKVVKGKKVKVKGHARSAATTRKKAIKGGRPEYKAMMKNRAKDKKSQSLRKMTKSKATGSSLV
jgi:hypothetical protein